MNLKYWVIRAEPLQFDYGKVTKVNQSPESAKITGALRQFKIVHMKLCVSRSSCQVDYPTESHEILNDAYYQALIHLVMFLEESTMTT
jgi:hypothetical protein